MGKLKFGKAFSTALNRGMTWAYHEIFTEAMVVFWIGCHLSMKFGTRFFPDWGFTRIDPDEYTSLDLLLWLLLGQNINGCVWDELISPWKYSMAQTIGTTALTSTPRGNVGYIGTLAIVGATFMLFVSVVCSAWANRHWRIPRWTQHLANCRRITTWFGYSTTYDGENWDRNPNASRWRFDVLTHLLMGAGMSVFVVLWLVFCALPVVILSGLTIAWIGRYCGEEAVFPMTVVCFSLLAGHCTGRIWGLWMNTTYFMELHEMIRKTTGVRFVVHPFAADQTQETANNTEAAKGHPSTAKRSTWLSTFLLVALPALMFVLCYSLDVLFRLPGFVDWINSFHLLSSTSKEDESTSTSESYWTYPNCTECCNKGDETGMCQATVMVSYYVNLHYPRWNTKNPVLLELFDIVFSPETERSFLIWIYSLAGVVVLPTLLLGLAEVAFILCLCCYGLVCLVRSIPQRIWSPPSGYKKFEGHYNRQTVSGNQFSVNGKPNEVRKDNQRSGRNDLEGNKTETIAPDKSTKKSKKTPFCVCALWMSFECRSLVAFSRMMFWLFLPFPVLGLIVPEQYQLPALLLLLSVVEVGLCYWIWKGICIGWREVRSNCDDHTRRVKVALGDKDTPLLTS